jgi:hypothetical protein
MRRFVGYSKKTNLISAVYGQRNGSVVSKLTFTYHASVIHQTSDLCQVEILANVMHDGLVLAKNNTFFGPLVSQNLAGNVVKLAGCAGENRCLRQSFP